MVMCFAQKPHKIMFYNMENFFDTIDDPTKPTTKSSFPTVRSGRRGRGVLLPSRRLQTRRQRRHPRADRLAAQLAHARHRDDVGNDRRRALPLHGRALALAAGRTGGIGPKRRGQRRSDSVDPPASWRWATSTNDRRSIRSPSGRQGQDQGVAAGRFLHTASPTCKAGLGTLAYRDAGISSTIS